jgi:HNH endonuclease
MHYTRGRRSHKVCSIEGCGKPILGRGWCSMHYNRWRATGDPGPAASKYLKGSGACSVEGCGRNLRGGGKRMCKLHYERQRVTGEAGPAKPKIGKKGTGHLHDGYRRMYVGQNPTTGRPVYRMEHILVMEQHLGRRLEPGENVHHRNGQRADNRRENLELWVKMQPTGQRVEDLVAFVVKHYPTLVAAELRARRREQRTGQLRLG